MKHIIFFDYLRAIAIIAVILIHSAAILVFLYPEAEIHLWSVANVYDSISRWCVPVFFMISGALLLNKTETLSEFFKKRFNKVLIPFLFWSLVYSVIIQIIVNRSTFSVWHLLKEFMSDGTFYHLWYVYYLIGLYLLTPLFRVFVKNASKQVIEYVLILWFVCSSVFGFIQNFFEITVDIGLPLISYVGYFLLGYYLNNFEVKKNAKAIFYTLGLLGMITTIGGTHILTVYYEYPYEYFYDYLTPNIIFMSLSVFLAVKSIIEKRKTAKVNPFIKLLSNSSYGVYLIHPIILTILMKITDIHITKPLTGIPLLTIVTLIISTLMVLIAIRIPFIRKLV